MQRTPWMGFHSMVGHTYTPTHTVTHYRQFRDASSSNHMSLGYMRNTKEMHKLDSQRWGWDLHTHPGGPPVYQTESVYKCLLAQDK